MMTVVRMRRKRWSNEVWRRAFLDFPRWDSTVQATQGSAKPGRGGRRKRRRRAAGARATTLYGRTGSEVAFLRACRLSPWDGWSPGDLGRRERRRRAKLRRRRARREARKAARAFLLALPAFYGRPTHREIALVAQRKIQELRRRTPGA